MVQRPSTHVCHSTGSWQAAIGTGRSISACAGLTALWHFVLRTFDVQPRLALVLTLVLADHATAGVKVHGLCSQTVCPTLGTMQAPQPTCGKEAWFCSVVAASAGAERAWVVYIGLGKLVQERSCQREGISVRGHLLM